jgi:hypothetical protein
MIFETYEGGFWQWNTSYLISWVPLFFEPDYVTSLSMGAIWNFCEGPGLP